MVSLLLRIDTDTIQSLITAPGGCLCLEGVKKHDGSDYGWVVRILVASDCICRVTPPVAAYASGGGKGMRGKGIGRSVGQACFAYPDLGFTSKTTRSSWTYVLLSRLEATSLAKAGSTIMKKGPRVMDARSKSATRLDTTSQNVQ